MYPPARANDEEDRSILVGSGSENSPEAIAEQSEVSERGEQVRTNVEDSADARWRGGGESPMRRANRIVREGVQRATVEFRSLIDDNVVAGVHYSPKRAAYEGAEEFALSPGVAGDDATPPDDFYERSLEFGNAAAQGRSGDDIRPVHTAAGLDNDFENTCFVNVGAQALLHNPPFVSALETYVRNSPFVHPLASRLWNWMVDAQQSKLYGSVAQPLFRHILADAPWYCDKGPTQCTICKKYSRIPVSREGVMPQQDAMEVLGEFLSQVEHVIPELDVWSFSEKYSHRCNSCGEWAESRNAPELQHMLHLEDRASLRDAFEAAFSPEGPIPFDCMICGAQKAPAPEENTKTESRLASRFRQSLFIVPQQRSLPRINAEGDAVGYDLVPRELNNLELNNLDGDGFSPIARFYKSGPVQGGHWMIAIHSRDGLLFINDTEVTLVRDGQLGKYLPGDAYLAGAMHVRGQCGVEVVPPEPPPEPSIEEDSQGAPIGEDEELAERKALVQASQATQEPQAPSLSHPDGAWCRSIRLEEVPLEVRERSLLRSEMDVFDSLSDTSVFKKQRTFTHRKVPRAFRDRLGMLQLELMQTQVESQIEVVRRRAEIVLCHLYRLLLWAPIRTSKGDAQTYEHGQTKTPAFRKRFAIARDGEF